MSIINALPQKKGKTNYYSPVIKLNGNISEETELVAKKLDVELQEYLTAYFKRNSNIQNAAPPAAIASDDLALINSELKADADNLPEANEITEPIDDLPF